MYISVLPTDDTPSFNSTYVLTIHRLFLPGNWLRDYSQAVDVGTLKGVQADTIRVLVWILAFMSFGYATIEFEVTSERLGVYRPEEHIDNPKDYADNVDARQFDQRLRGPIMPVELAVDPNTGMKNYIANEAGGWATSLGYVRYSFARSIHFGRMYTHGAQRGREEDLCEALRCLGQGLHCLEDFGAHTNYTELSLRELGFLNVFPHVGTQTMINLHGKQVFPLVTGTFGGVDFLHSVLGEASDHVTQTEVNHSEVEQLNSALSNAQQANQSGNRGFGGQGSNLSGLTEMLGQLPGTSNLVQEAQSLQASSDAQAAENERMTGSRDATQVTGQQGYVPYSEQYSASAANTSFGGPPTGAQSFEAPPHAGGFGGPQTGYQSNQATQLYQGSHAGFQDPSITQPEHFGNQQNTSQGYQTQPASQGSCQGMQNSQPGGPTQGAQMGTQQTGQQGAQQPGVAGINVNIDPQQAIQKIYPMLAFRDKVVRSIAGIVSKIPGLEKMIETISEKVTLFVMGLLAPFVKPIIAAASNALKQGSGAVVSASQRQQYLVWEDPTSSDPTHSLLSKDHFSNILNEPSGQVAAVILQYVAPRVIYGWDHPEVADQEIMNDISRVFHHPAARDVNCEIHRNMFAVVEKCKSTTTRSSIGFLRIRS